ncbi:4-hydroxyphenylpyruvate dioxygenase [Acaryochloris thomasi RCC1774]|uniref:4-hydroxyphenylpyruvate dioxygenase n=1 Tax=Acaryochloris thomasi RCC1774 TaxID=1764569 RepID=A0A2W1JDP1_9CYAN|nr:4-hydroxyphenylpyruvate dioxygenase [Acaryochloris thomasi]PZD71909.1 4-hydroxyphenylpyruvate dioxygenase [Acaryochloris thomasi RCC1774]
MDIDHAHFYVHDAERSRDWFVRTMGFRAIGQQQDLKTQTEILQTGAVTIRVSSPRTSSSPVAAYLKQHPPGVADLAFRVTDLEALLERVKRHRVSLLSSSPSDRHQVTIQGWGNLRHTLVQSQAKASSASTTSEAIDSPVDNGPTLLKIDHAVLNVERDQLQDAIGWYQAVLGFEARDYFNIQTERSALCSQVLVHPEGTAQFPINEPASMRSQIQEFLDCNHGPGIQHIALSTVNITQTVRQLRQRGLSFLEIPPSYYAQLRQQASSMLELEAIEEQRILVELQQPSQALLQTFTQPIFAQPTFFFEVIERRLRARGFGERNFTALFEAIEREQLKRGTLV